MTLLKSRLFCALFILIYRGVLLGDSLSHELPLFEVRVGDTAVAAAPAFSDKIVGHVADSVLQSLLYKNYPFASVTPEIIPGRPLVAQLSVDSGVYIDSMRYRFYCAEPLKPWLLPRAIGGGDTRPYDYDEIFAVEPTLMLQPFVSSLTVGTPQLTEMSDTASIVVPIQVVAKRSLFFDGSVVWSSEGDAGFVGYVDVALLNLFWAGEEINFDFYGDKEIQRVGLGIDIPYFLKTPLSLSLLGKVEVGREQYGYLEGKFGVGYDIWRIWQAGMSFRYYEITQEEGDQRQFAGIELSLLRRRQPFYHGPFQWGGRLSAGSGVSIEESDKFPRGDFSVNLDFQWPLPGKFAIGSSLNAGAVATEFSEKLHETEKIRVGGMNSIRGYAENQYSFVGAGSLLSEFRFYMSRTGGIFLFGDVGTGVSTHFNLSDLIFLFGYGAGIRIPTGKVQFSLVWARHLHEPPGPGRIHVGISN